MNDDFLKEKILFYEKKILILSNNINDEISKLIKDDIERSYSYKKNIFYNVRNLIEFFYKIMYLKNYEDNEKNNYENIESENEILNKAKKFIKGNHYFIEVDKIFNSFQRYVMHSQLDNYGVDIIYYKYLNYLIYLRELFFKKLQINIIQNVDLLINFKFKDVDNDYYSLIFNKITMLEKNTKFNNEGMFTVLQSIPRICKGEIFYEITLSISSDLNLKNNRFIVFSKKNIQTKYQIKISLIEDEIEFSDIKFSIIFVKDYFINVPLTAMNNLLTVFGLQTKIKKDDKEYNIFTEFINQNKINLIDFIDNNSIINTLQNKIKDWCFLNLLLEIKKMNEEKKPGINILRYFLYTMKASVIKNQIDENKNDNLSKLYLKNKSIPFDAMPIASSLCKHNPSIYDLIECIDLSERKHEFFNNYIWKKCEETNSIYVHDSDLNFKDHDNLMKEFNSKLSDYALQKERKIKKYGNYYFISSMENTLVNIIKNLKKLELNKNFNILKKNDLKTVNIDCDEKKNILNNLFLDSSIAIIYGNPGTGKSKLIEYITYLYSNNKKIIIANTNFAIESLKRKIKVPNSNFFTIKKFLKSDEECDLLIVDECSVVSNKDILNILNTKFNFLVLVGDKNQLGSIEFGNWFLIMDSFISNKCFFTLEKNYRAESGKLQNLWKKTRENSDDLLEFIIDMEYHSKIDSKLFFNNDKDKISLCFNYDGVYGINNINKIFQLNNENKIFKIGVLGFKIGDPIIFLENNLDELHNNLKGIIKKIDEFKEMFLFHILVDKKIDENIFGIKVINYEGEKTVIELIIYKEINYYENKIFIPFQLCYATSIHKSQGLEYDYVNLIIPNYMENKISQKIFYTAITRAKKDVKICLFEKSANKIIDVFKKDNDIKDINIIKNKFNL